MKRNLSVALRRVSRPGEARRSAHHGRPVPLGVARRRGTDVRSGGGGQDGHRSGGDQDGAGRPGGLRGRRAPRGARARLPRGRPRRRARVRGHDRPVAAGRPLHRDLRRGRHRRAASPAAASTRPSSSACARRRRPSGRCSRSTRRPWSASTSAATTSSSRARAPGPTACDPSRAPRTSATATTRSATRGRTSSPRRASAGVLGPALAATFERWRQWDLRASRRVTRYLANSETTRARIRQAFARDAAVVYPPVETQRFAPGRVGEHFLIVSELMAHKDIQTAVRAFTRLGRELVVVGDGPEGRRLRHLAGPTVRFAGRVSDAEVASLMRSAQALVVTAVEEFGIAAIEAQASGRPVLAADAGGVRETVLEGRTGAFFAPGRRRRAGGAPAGLRPGRLRPRGVHRQRRPVLGRRASGASSPRRSRRRGPLPRRGSRVEGHHGPPPRSLVARLAPRSLRCSDGTDASSPRPAHRSRSLLGLVPAATAGAGAKVPLGLLRDRPQPGRVQGAMTDADLDRRRASWPAPASRTCASRSAGRDRARAGRLRLRARPTASSRASARHRIPLLANVISTPRWASSRPNDLYPNRWAPKDPQTFAALHDRAHRALRPAGSFWAPNPTIPKTPVRQWQIWNEQRAAVFWSTRPWASSLHAPAARRLPGHPPRRPRGQGRGRLARGARQQVDAVAAGARALPRPRAQVLRRALGAPVHGRHRPGQGERQARRRDRPAHARARCAAAGTRASRSSSPSCPGRRPGARSPSAACSGSRRRRRARSPA